MTCGTLYKRSDHIKQWRKRYIQLNHNDTNLRYYYDEQKTSAPRGVIPLPYGSVVKCSARDPHKEATAGSEDQGMHLYVFEVLYKAGMEFEQRSQSESQQVKKLLLAATSEEERERWMLVFLKRVSLKEPHEKIEDPIDVLNDFNVKNRQSGQQNVIPMIDLNGNSASSSENGAVDSHFQDIPSDLMLKLNQSLEHFLQMCDEPLESWTNGDENDPAVFIKRGVTVVQRTMPNVNCQIVRGDAVVHHHPIKCFDAILDLHKKKEYEKHLHCAVRLQKLNSHTFIDYLRYVGTWPSTARDFCYLLHWRCLPERNNSIVIIAINHDDSNLCPLRDDAIRGEIFLSGYLLTPIEGEDGVVSSCKFQRISAINVKGIVPNAIIRSMDQSSALFPSKISRYLTAVSETDIEYINESSLSQGRITDEILINDVISKIPTRFDSINDDTPTDINLSVPFKDESNHSDSESLGTEFEPEIGANSSSTSQVSYIPVLILLLSIAATPSLVWFISFSIRSFIKLRKETLVSVSLCCSVCVLVLMKPNMKYERRGALQSRHPMLVSIENLLPTTFTILLPLYLFNLSKTVAIPYVEICVAFSIFCSVRSTTKFCLGNPLIHTTSGVKVGLYSHKNLGTGIVTCRFNIDLKRILKYVSEKKKQDKRSNNARNDISVTHVCIKAVARALSEVQALNSRRVNIPLLGIQGFYPNKNIDISISTSGTAHDTVKLSNIRGISTREIADQLKRKVLDSSVSKRHSSLLPNVLQVPLDMISEIFDVGNGSSAILRGKKFGSCVIITTPDAAGLEVDIDIQPSQEAGMPSVVVVMGGVRLARPNESSSDHGKISSRPSLSFSISIDSPACGIMACRKFVERVQKLLLNPELIEPLSEANYPSIL